VPTPTLLEIADGVIEYRVLFAAAHMSPLGTSLQFAALRQNGSDRAISGH